MAAAREASHAGSWYTDDGAELDAQLQGWLEAAGAKSHAPARAIIAPHAGYSYSGPTAAFAYKQIDPSTVKRVFVLGPSHHVYLNNCALSNMVLYKTPVGNLTLDRQLILALHSTGQFGYMTKKVDEDEHSIEMHLPYIAKVMRGHDFTLVPILVGSLSPEREAFYGELLAPYLADPVNLFVVSSDFCHWGRRFQYTHYDKADGAIYQSIEKLDRTGMALIESKDTVGFSRYLLKTQNTICGRHPIGVLLNAIGKLDKPCEVKFVRYAQSSQCTSQSDSSVSYASASAVVDE